MDNKLWITSCMANPYPNVYILTFSLYIGAFLAWQSLAKPNHWDIGAVWIVFYEIFFYF